MASILVAWKWLDGQKTVIGVSVLAILTYAQQAGVHLPFSIDQARSIGHDVITAIGACIASIGLLHKVVKAIMDIVGSMKKSPSA